MYTGFCSSSNVIVQIKELALDKLLQSREFIGFLDKGVYNGVFTRRNVYFLYSFIVYL